MYVLQTYMYRENAVGQKNQNCIVAKFLYCVQKKFLYWAKVFHIYHNSESTKVRNRTYKQFVKTQRATYVIIYLPAAIMLFFDKFWQVQLPTEVAEAVVKTEAGRSSMQSFKELWLVKSSFWYSSHFNFQTWLTGLNFVYIWICAADFVIKSSATWRLNRKTPMGP